ncbi:MAG: prepilin-type N-terminal cleavage/methylation domain-containing protein [Myxococcota bacterium]|jgi:general secretion pathway protein I
MRGAGPSTGDGFTLLEVMVAMAILAVSMSAIVGINVGAMAMSSKVKGLTVASFLARGKMIEVEEKIREKGFPDFSTKESGDFSEEGYPNIRWTSEIIKIKIPQVDPSKVDLGGGLTKLSGSEQKPDSLGIGPSGGGMGMLSAGIPMLMNQIENAIREVRVTVLWMDGKREQNMAVTTHIVNIPGAEVGIGVTQVQVGAQGTGQGAAASGAAQGSGGFGGLSNRGVPGAGALKK